MRSVYELRTAEARKIEGHLLSGEDKIVRPWLFTDFAKLCWPEKTAACIAAIADKDERTAKRWLSGEFEPPIIVVLAVVNKMFERRQ